MNYPNLKEVSKKIAIFILCVALGWYLKGRLSPSGQPVGFGMGEVYILAQKAQNKDISSFNDKISYIEAINEVSILPQVTGTIEKVLFEEGSLVNEGDVLFEIDTSKYQAAYDLAKAKLDSARANLVKTERDYNRQVQLSDQKFASKATFDMSESAFLQAKALVEEAQANVDMASIDLDNTKVTAPISGKIGKALVTKGNYVVASNVVMAKIVQVNPVRISFALTDKEIAKVQTMKHNPEDLTAQIILPTGEVIREKVVGTFSDNAINASTATMSVYTDVANEGGRLIPGNYVQSAITDSKPVNSVVVPQSALNYDKDGAYIYIAKINNDTSKENDLHGIAEQRRIVLGDKVIGSDQAVISGLKEGELVVIQGNVKIQNNSQIKIGLVEK